MYYQGDYTRARYYRGDPGFLSFLKGIGSTVAGFIPGVGPLVSKAISAIPTPVKRAGLAVAKVATEHPTLTAAGAAATTAAAAGGIALHTKGSSMSPPRWVECPWVAGEVRASRGEACAIAGCTLQT